MDYVRRIRSAAVVPTGVTNDQGMRFGGARQVRVMYLACGHALARPVHRDRVDLGAGAGSVHCPDCEFSTSVRGRRV